MCINGFWFAPWRPTHCTGFTSDVLVPWENCSLVNGLGSGFKVAKLAASCLWKLLDSTYFAHPRGTRGFRAILLLGLPQNKVTLMTESQGASTRPTPFFSKKLNKNLQGLLERINLLLLLIDLALVLHFHDPLKGIAPAAVGSAAPCRWH